MKISYTLAILGVVLSGTVFSIGEANGAGFIKFDGIEGESMDKDYKGWSDLLSLVESSEVNKDSSSTRNQYETSQEVIVLKEIDKASPKLTESIVIGKAFPTVLINLCVEEKDNCSLAYELINVRITSYSVTGSENNIPVEEISLNYEKIVRISGLENQTKADVTDEESDRETAVPSEDPVGDETSSTLKPRVPDWVQTTAQFWVDRNVSDREFTDALGFLVKENIIDVEVESQLTEMDPPEEEEPQVPAWIAQTTKWWISGEVPEDQFLEGIKWMIKNKIIRGL